MSSANPKFAPPEVMEAALHTIYRACVDARNCTLPGFENIEKANSLMEAVHAVPVMLYDWHEGRLRELRNHFGCFHHEDWPCSSNLVSNFDDRLAANMEVRS